jgi:tetratricopeptide (TPR) repeat protein
MPRGPSSDVAHTAITDHRVPRRPDAAPLKPAGPGLPPGRIPVRAFDADRFPPGDPDADRDLGLALADMSRQYPEARAEISTAALPLLETAVRTWPGDVAARAAKGHALLQLGRRDEALAEFEAVLAACPEHETALAEAAEAAEAPRHRPAAVDYWRRAAAVDPWCAHYRAQEARVRAVLDDWPGAVAAARAAVALNPSMTEPRLVLIDAHVRDGDREAAAAEFDALWSLNPPNREQLRRWFENHRRPGPGR